MTAALTTNTTRHVDNRMPVPTAQLPKIETSDGQDLVLAPRHEEQDLESYRIADDGTPLREQSTGRAFLPASSVALPLNPSQTEATSIRRPCLHDVTRHTGHQRRRNPTQRASTPTTHPTTVTKTPLPPTHHLMQEPITRHLLEKMQSDTRASTPTPHKKPPQ